MVQAIEIIGGSAWESNPPAALLRRHTGFEVQEGHQCPIHFRRFNYTLISVKPAWKKTSWGLQAGSRPEFDFQPPLGEQQGVFPY